jgi:hypothetical protein
VAGSCGILQTERLNSVLQDVGESDKAVLGADDWSCLLDSGTMLLYAVDIFQKLVLVLEAGLDALHAGDLPERESALGYVLV